MNAPKKQNRYLVTTATLCRELNISHFMLRKWLKKDENFPKPVATCDSKRWILPEVLDYIREGLPRG